MKKELFLKNKLNGDLTMRLAKENEKCLTLDEIEYKCSADMVVISDDIKLHGIGGVMGGLDSGCNLDTKNVFLEVALFDPISITKTGRKLNVQSDARYRFERGVDSESINWGVDVASKMILDICGGECSNIVSTEIHKIDQKIIQFNIEKVKSIGGIDIPINDQVKILSDLEFTVKKINESFKRIGYVLKIKLHYYDLMMLKFPDLSNINFIKDDSEVMELMSETHILITDYSGAYFDFLLTQRPIVFAAFDIDDYVTNDRAFNYDYDEIICGPKCSNWNEVVDAVNQYIECDDKYADKRKEMNYKFNECQDFNFSENVYEMIKSLVVRK